MLNAFALAGVALVIGAMLPAQAQTALPPIGSVGHGSILGANGKDVAPTRALILASQKYYIDRLLSQLPGDRQTQLLGQRARMSSGRAVVEEDEVYANSIFIEKLISVAKPADALAMDSINSVIVNQYAKMVRPPGSVAAVSGIALAPSAIMQAAVDSEGLKKKQQDSEGLSGQAYIDACAAAGVPVPPPWGDKRWKSNGRLQTKFILETEVAEVFWYESKSPVGVCIALPRWKENDKKNVNVGALGIICQGNTTGTSCYWDNMKKKKPVDIPIVLPKDATVPLTTFGGGDDLIGGNGICTDCHAGENTFIVHPDSALDLGPILRPTKWVRPIVPKAWNQNPGPSSALDKIVLKEGEKSCLRCHNEKDRNRFPTLSLATLKYCTTILPQAVEHTMPPTDDDAPPSPRVPFDGTLRLKSPAYKTHVDALLATCQDTGATAEQMAQIVKYLENKWENPTQALQ